MRSTRWSARHHFAPAAAAALTLSATLPAHAHHATGKPPETTMQGLLSGMAHPVIGPDHLLFLLVLGALVCTVGRRSRYLAAISALAGSLAGALVHLVGVDLPAVEPGIALSIVVGGALLARRHGPVPLGLVALAGVFHGYAFAESAIGAPPAALAAYLLGIALMQAAIIVGVGRLARTPEASPTEPAVMVVGPGAGIAAMLTGGLLLGLPLL